MIACLTSIITYFNYAQKHHEPALSAREGHHASYPQGQAKHQHTVQGGYEWIDQGSNLMDVTNSIVNQNVNIYGLCDKQLACTTCRVDIEKKYEVVPAASDEEMDVLLTTKNFSERTSRMACQIRLSEEMDGMEVRIPESNVNKGM